MSAHVSVAAGTYSAASNLADEKGVGGKRDSEVAQTCHSGWRVCGFSGNMGRAADLRYTLRIDRVRLSADENSRI